MLTPATAVPEFSLRSKPSPAADGDARLHRVASQLEASFLSEMLKHAGFGKARDSFDGGTGEDQFASLLRDAQARTLAEGGGVGLAESIFHALKERQDER
ncbi:rod-binding protein [Tropicimonas sp. IMCC34043]|uniref:rod-binding protein n=1 Tax=Tropicimonas sp. IMCC34043 TaxID=2248760 RepID=UPI000E273431|nr:rod-binding protein [Tropicimonas sp. IMCC34043]